MSSKLYEEIDRPLIYICSPNPFDFKRANQLGYKGQIYYLKGERNDSQTNLNWLGYDSKDVNETFKDVFVYNYTELQVVDDDQAIVEPVFFEHLGHCRMVSNISTNPLKVLEIK